MALISSLLGCECAQINNESNLFITEVIARLIHYSPNGDFTFLLAKGEKRVVNSNTKHNVIAELMGCGYF